jgi:hypothetical protein
VASSAGGRGCGDAGRDRPLKVDVLTLSALTQPWPALRRALGFKLEKADRREWRGWRAGSRAATAGKSCSRAGERRL